MNLVDIIILVMILLGALTGFIRGFLKETIIFLGTILVVVLSFVFKNTLSQVLYSNLKFFNFGGLTSLNIILYEVLAFIISVAILSFILAVLIKVTGIIEKVLNATVILAIPSKILGSVVGIVQSILICYVFLFVLSMPMLKLDIINESKYGQLILTKTPIVSNVTDNITTSFNEIKDFTKTSINLKDIDGTNTKIVEVLLKNKIVTVDSVKLLIEKDKLVIDNSEELLEKYKEA